MFSFSSNVVTVGPTDTLIYTIPDPVMWVFIGRLSSSDLVIVVLVRANKTYELLGALPFDMSDVLEGELQPGDEIHAICPNGKAQVGLATFTPQGV